MVGWWKRHPEEEQKLIFFLSQNRGAFQLGTLGNIAWRGVTQNLNIQEG